MLRRRRTARSLSFVAVFVIFFWGVFQSIKWNVWYARHPGFGGKWDEPFSIGCRVPEVTGPRANATLLMLARNSDIQRAIQSVQSVESHFNHWFHYPWTFLNNEPFSDEFMEAMRHAASSKCEFGTIPSEHWEFPSDVNDERIQRALLRQGDQAIKYGSVESYHQMCRFYSGFFFRNSLVAKYEWYWRVEPDVSYFCDVTYDVFREMERHGKVFGFTVFMRENQKSIENLFRHTQAFRRQWKLAKTDLWDAVTSCILDIGDATRENPVEQMNLDTYNMCHFWSNFEIARVALWDSPVYNAYFEALDAAGGFWDERWGDAPVHTLGVAMMLNASQIHYFRDIGYSHGVLGSCPGNAPGRQLPVERQDMEGHAQSSPGVTPDPERVNGVGCRCSCMTEHRDFKLERDPCLMEGLIPVLGGGVHRLNRYGL